MDNIKLYTAYFTDEVCAALRNGQLKYDVAWGNYITFHKSKGIFDRKKAIYMLNEFRYIFQEITCDIQKPPADFQRFLMIKNIEA